MDTLQPELKNSQQEIWYSMRMGVWVSIAVVIIFAVGLFYFLRQQSAPMNVIISPASYPAGTQIEVYKGLPNEFPKEILMAGGTLKHSDIVRNADKSFIVTCVYNVAQSLPIAMSSELDTLKKAGWQVNDSKIDSSSGYVSAAKDAASNVIITFTLDGSGSEVSYQLSGKKS